MGATSMNADRKKRLEAAGFKFGTVGELFNLSEAEELLVEVKVALAEAIRELREVRSLSQADLALLIGSGQARVSKLERALDSTSLDTLFRCMLALGASRQDLAKTIGRSPRPKKAVDEKGPRRQPHSSKKSSLHSERRVDRGKLLGVRE
jgi:transcriptional regulator with XRE-family HTH domain